MNDKHSAVVRIASAVAIVGVLSAAIFSMFIFLTTPQSKLRRIADLQRQTDSYSPHSMAVGLLQVAAHSCLDASKALTDQITSQIRDRALADRVLIRALVAQSPSRPTPSVSEAKLSLQASGNPDLLLQFVSGVLKDNPSLFVDHLNLGASFGESPGLSFQGRVICVRP